MRYIVLLIFVITIVSCNENFLTVNPQDTLSEEGFWQSEDDVEKALAAVYNGWESYYFIHYLDAASDNGYNVFPWRGFENIVDGNMTPSSTRGNVRVYDFYSYDRIRRVNYFLSKVDEVPNLDNSLKERYKAEARFIRAYNYFRKVIWFGGVPLVTEVISEPEDSHVPRSSKEVIVEFILTELNEVANILPNLSAEEAGGHATRGAALALKARLELYEGMYAEAMNTAKAIMDSGVYALNPDFIETFRESNERNSEVIMDIGYVKNDYPMEFHDLNPGRDGGNNGISTQHSLVEAFESIDGIYPASESSLYDPLDPFKNRDPRLAATVLYSGQEWNGRYLTYVNEFNPDGSSNPEYAPTNIGSRTGYGIHKYNVWVPVAEKNNQGVNVIVFRYAEVLLTYAEAAIEENILSEDVYAALDAIRTRAGMPPVDRAIYNNQEKLRELVRRERRVELAWEGLRYQDIKRWDIGETALDGPVIGSYLGHVDESTGEVTWDFSEQFIPGFREFIPEREYLVPIPQTEIDANEAIGMEDQNPGY